MHITLHEDPIEDSRHTRYLLIADDAPAIATIHGLIKHNTDEPEPLNASVLTLDGRAFPVQVEFDGAGNRWSVFLDGDECDDAIEEIAYNPDGTVAFHQRYIDGFATAEVPVFMVGVTNRR